MSSEDRDFTVKHGGIEIVDPADRGLPQDLRFNAMGNSILAEELKAFLFRNKDKWGMQGDEQGLIYEVCERLKSWS